MNVTRIFLWECDLCSAEERLPQYGLPSGWKWYIEKGKVLHLCGQCTELCLSTGWKLNKGAQNRLIPPSTVPLEAVLTPETGKFAPEPLKGHHGATEGQERASLNQL